MSNDDWKTLRVPADAWERAQDQRKAAGRTWGEQIVRPDGQGGGTAVYAVGDDEPVDVLGPFEGDVEFHRLDGGPVEAGLAEIRELIDKLPERTAKKVREELDPGGF